MLSKKSAILTLFEWPNTSQDVPNFTCHNADIISRQDFNILWHEDPLLGNEHEIRNYITVVISNRRTLFSVRSVPRYHKQGKLRATKREPSAWGSNWATLFLGDINTGTWTSRLGESRIWVSKICSRVPLDSDPRMTALARISSNCKRQTRSLVRESAPHQQLRNCLRVIKIWS
jgi:hypothetical protein